ncbi:PREDICTED: peptidoglycan-recognition protein LE [Rhagoletis zephyria]|uniref:peptidoglycan-recognition protein LE n=1 Tax=Rhagoletis zephyria TaxID=28612 RepID=UPI000811698A|nr:PREDICTED: peptidoglycan-recognition protein LE [Rhagoletis zephyria]XP_017492184.1 PREDICTED: peptidoglycan-recognition protein LE [Rhagoletis zephyria]
MSQTSGLNAEKEAATREWIERQEQFGNSGIEDDISSLADSSIISSSDGDYETEAEADFDSTNNTLTTKVLGTQYTPTDMAVVIENLRELLNSINSVQTLENVHIENSSNVRIGNVTNINGNIQIIQRIKKRLPEISRQTSTASVTTRGNASESLLTEESEEQEERVKRDAFIDRIKYKIPKELCAVLPRSTWLAQRPMEDYDFIPEPVNLVIISHTATESSEKQAINVRLIRDIQCFHIESREWNDIAYNFLVGCDGNVYEGRGWGVVGAHTIGYNSKSVGIAFIGCFMRELPSEPALNACKNFLKRGVEEGHLAPDYKLIAHCQCRSTESPGRKLYEELQTWEHFYNIGEELDKE